MDGMLSQEEINALLGNMDADSTSEEAASDAVQTSSDISNAEKLTPEERCRFWLITGLILQLLLFPTRH